MWVRKNLHSTVKLYVHLFSWVIDYIYQWNSVSIPHSSRDPGGVNLCPLLSIEWNSLHGYLRNLTCMTCFKRLTSYYLHSSVSCVVCIKREETGVGYYLTISGAWVGYGVGYCPFTTWFELYLTQFQSIHYRFWGITVLDDLRRDSYNEVFSQLFFGLFSWNGIEDLEMI